MPSCPLHITFACDANRNYAMLLRACVASILHNADESDQHHFHILDGGIAQQDKDALHALQKVKSFTITYHALADRFSFHRFDPTFLSEAAFYRIIVGDILHDIPRTLYLDTDLITLCSLKALYTAELNNCAFGACINGLADLHADRLGTPKGKYFNTGVLLIDLDKWRMSGIYNKCIETAEKYADKIVFHDQDILNLIFRDAYCRLPQKWNMLTLILNQPPEDQSYGAYQSTQPAIVHFAGRHKLTMPYGTLLIKYAQAAGFSIPEVVQAWAGKAPADAAQ